MMLAPLYLECLSGGDASTQATASAAHVPLDIVAAVGDGVPVVVAFGISRDGKHLPAAANFDAFDDVDSRHNVSPASRIFADSMGDSMWSKRQKTKGVGRSWHSTTELLPLALLLFYLSVFKALSLPYHESIPSIASIQNHGF